MALQNTWHHRRVADGSAKACWICYKPSTSVLITPDNKDFFYTCLGHLKDRGFCLPDADEAAVAAERTEKEELDREIAKVKKEYDEKQKLKREKRKEKEKNKGKEKDKDAKKTEEDEDKEDEKAKNEKIKEMSKANDDEEAENGPRIYTLKKNFYQMRLDRIRNAEIAKRNRERMQNPTLFPSVPSGKP
ncbi:VPS4-associated protein 1 [Massariosphaeria phaeospora]|uniref:VPS4-associated protein 1 n=1 Tax=Massariosphaeria phaeospora TaxID=100035 RepID=A0A7C8MQC5_9PLEO|nr:VPS4-associated protein 1 [Massariosphaeria phaeospora]